MYKHKLVLEAAAEPTEITDDQLLITKEMQP